MSMNTSGRERQAEGAEDQHVPHGQPGRRGELLEARLPVQPGAPTDRRLDQRVEEVMDDDLRGGQAAGEVDGADDRLEGVGEDRRLVAPTGRLLASSEEQVVAQPDDPGDIREGARGVLTFFGVAFVITAVLMLWFVKDVKLTLVAIVVYMLVAWLVAKVVWLLAGENRSATRTVTNATRARMD